MCVLDCHQIPGFLFYDDSNSLDFVDAIGILIAYSFVAAEEEGGTTFTMHPLVQLSMRKWLAIHGEMEKRTEEALSLLSAKFPVGVYGNWKICEALQPHADTVLGYRYTSPYSQSV
jgi:hypothetical protein